MFRVAFVALVIPCVITVAMPAAAQSPTVRDLTQRVNALEEMVTTLEKQVAALQTNSGGSRTYAVPFQQISTRTTLLDVPGKIFVQGDCIPTSSSPFPVLRVRGGNGEAAIWHNEVGSVISGSTEGLLAPAIGQGLVEILPNPMNGVLFAQGHIALTTSNEVVTFSSGGVFNGTQCVFSVQAEVTPLVLE